MLSNFYYHNVFFKEKIYRISSGKRPRPRSMGGLTEKNKNKPINEETSEKKLVENKVLLKKIKNSEYRAISIHPDSAKNVSKEIEKNKKIIESLNEDFKKINIMNDKYAQPDYTCILDQKIASFKHEIREIRREIQLLSLEQKRFERDLNKAVPNIVFSLDLEQNTLNLRKNIDAFLDTNNKTKKKISEIQHEIKKKFDSYAIADKEIKNVTNEAIKNKIYSVMNAEHIYNLMSLKALKIEQSNAMLNKSRISSESKTNKEITKLKIEMKQYDILVAEIEQKIEHQNYIFHSYEINKSINQQSIINYQMEIHEEKKENTSSLNQVESLQNPEHFISEKILDKSSSYHENQESSFDEKYMEEKLAPANNKKTSILSMEIKPIDKSKVFRHLQSVPDISAVNYGYKNRFSELAHTSLNSKVNRYNPFFETVSLKFESGTSIHITQNNEEIKKTEGSQKELIENFNEDENYDAKQNQVKFQYILEKQDENEEEQVKSTERQKIERERKESEDNLNEFLEEKNRELNEFINNDLVTEKSQISNQKTDGNINITKNDMKSQKADPVNRKENPMHNSNFVFDNLTEFSRLEESVESDPKAILTEPVLEDSANKIIPLKKTNNLMYSKPFKIRKFNRAIIHSEPKENKSSFALEDNQNNFFNDDFSNLKKEEEKPEESKTNENPYIEDTQPKNNKNSNDNPVIDESNSASDENHTNPNNINDNNNALNPEKNKSSLFDEKIEYFNINTLEKERSIEKQIERTISEAEEKFEESAKQLEEPKNDTISNKSSYDHQLNELEVKRVNRSQRSSVDSGKREQSLRKNNKKMSTFYQNENYDTFEITFSGMDYDEDEKKDSQKKKEPFEIKQQLKAQENNKEEEKTEDKNYKKNDRMVEHLKMKNTDPNENSIISNFFENLDI